MKHARHMFAIGWAASALLASIAPAAAEDALGFNRDVRPIISANCFACHGFDEHAREADLRLDLFEEATATRDDGAAIVPGDPDASTIIQRITHDDPRKRMPPPHTGHEVTDDELAVLRRWIEQGAEYEEHWAFIPPTRPAPPDDLSAPDWVQNPIDAFVLAELDAQGIVPSEPADRRTLIRRVSFDLTGLPPTPEQVERFVNDNSPDAYDRLVDRLLDSPDYGEHMTRFWLDAARYADTHGYQYDLTRTQWPWREWVIDAFNANMPFDQFTIEQIAGDLLPEATENQRLASAFNRNHPITIEGGIINEEYVTEYVMDRVDTTGTVWLGLTMNCARCHDHKFDPVTMEDFYSFYAFFNQVPERGHGQQNDFAPTMQVTPPMQQRQLDALEQELTVLAQQRDEIIATGGDDRARWIEQLREQIAGWQVVTPAEITSANGTTFEQLDDGSALAIGPNPERETYEAVLHVDGPVAGIRLEALTHDSLPHTGPGRAPNANFVLSRIEVTATPLDNHEAEPRDVIIAEARADFSQDGYPVTDALDDADRSGWAVAGNEHRVDREASFLFAEPVDHEGPVEMRIRLVHDWGGSHSIGRFRLATIEQPPGAISPAVIAAIKTDAESRTADQQDALDTYLLAEFGDADARAIATRLNEASQRLDRLHNERPTVMIMADREQREPSYVLEQGLYDAANKDRPVSPRTPDALPPMNDLPANRLGLAKWMVRDDQPLTARVTVNRFWQQVFGIGIVETAEDFGTQGDWPSHPRLLDWLAVEFVESGWDVKHVMRTIVTSATYQQASRFRSDLHEMDPDNRLLWRGPRHRLDAEMVRDNALAIAGLLSDRMGGPSVYPYHPDGLWEEVNNRPGFMEEYIRSEGENLYRRSLYTFWKRSVPPPTMQAFDATAREVCLVRRSRTNTPLQALAAMNDPQFIEAARFMAERMIRDGGDTFRDRVAHGFLLAMAREPEPAELDVLRELYDHQHRRFAGNADAADQLLTVGEGERDASLDPLEHATMTTIARTILNLDETITKE